MAIDYGQKRVGLAVTDEFKIIATALDTVPVHEIFSYLKEYFNKENVECVVIGDPKQMNNTPSESVRFIDPFIRKFNTPIQSNRSIFFRFWYHVQSVLFPVYKRKREMKILFNNFINS